MTDGNLRFKSAKAAKNLTESLLCLLDGKWNEYMPKVLNDLLKDNIIAKVATQPFELNGKSMIMDHHDSCGKTTFTSAQLRI
jgi:hypothetical protein